MTDEPQQKPLTIWAFSVFVTGLILVAIWLIFSLSLGVSGNEVAFQRFGVFAQVGALLMFTATLSRKLPDENESEMLQKHYERVGVEGVRSIFSDEERADGSVDKVIEFFRKRGGPGQVFASVRRWMLSLEISVLSLGTLQTGFGDWFVCSLQSWSLSTCSH
jgi:hypothetical protein